MKKTFLKNKKNIQFLIIGLGLIGGSIAKRLSKNSFEVLAIDKNKSHLNYAKKSKILNGGLEKIDSKKKLFVISKKKKNNHTTYKKPYCGAGGG